MLKINKICPKCNHLENSLEVLVNCSRCSAWYFLDDFIENCKENYNIQSFLRPTGEDLKILNNIVKKFNWIFDEKLELYAFESTSYFKSTIHKNGEAGLCTYSIKLDGTWTKNNDVVDYYVGQTGKHPCIRFLTHLLEDKKGRGNAMIYIDDLKFYPGYHGYLERRKKELLMEKVYLDQGYSVYSR
tara:strand:+ start:164 stop:721 length:558 start_codon:yes stop_codon:yes gene_type:complete